MQWGPALCNRGAQPQFRTRLVSMLVRHGSGFSTWVLRVFISEPCHPALQARLRVSRVVAAAVARSVSRLACNDRPTDDMMKFVIKPMLRVRCAGHALKHGLGLGYPTLVLAFLLETDQKEGLAC